MSQSIHPNSSSDEAAPAGSEEAGPGPRPLVARLAQEFGADAATLARIASLFDEVHERAPDLFVPAPGALAAAFAEGGAVEPVHAALAEWALDAEGEPIERMRRDCLRFQSAMTRGALRLYAADGERCTESLLALQRFVFLQLALIASLAGRGQEGGGVVRTLPTPEYAAFMDIFRTTIEGHRQEGRELGLLLIQVEKVDQVDRLLGLQRGEAFMLRIARRMREGVLRKQDQLGRVSRDQFACLLPRIAGEGVGILAANKILGALQAPIPIGERSFAPEAAIGIAIYPAHGADPQTLTRNAKLAVRAAAATAERVALYEPAHGASEELKVRYEARLRYALEQGALALAFEPQLDLRSGAVSGLACVLHWQDAELGAVSEAEAMAAAERAGLAGELTWWLINNALRLGAEFARAGIGFQLAVKVAAASLLQPDFPEFVDRALRTWGIRPERVLIEISESGLAGASGQLPDTLLRLKMLALRLGIEGFGSGASPVSALAQLPLDEAKLAARFAGDMLSVPLHEKLVRALVRLAQNLGLEATAEGVADAATAQALAALGCGRIQGGHVSPPLTPQQILEKFAPQGR